MEYVAYAIIGIGLGVSTSSIITRNSKRVQNAIDVLEAKKEWVRMVSNQKKLGEKNDRRNQKR
jgi:hypothetical protein